MWQKKSRHSMHVSPFSSVAAGDSCGRCLHWPSEWRVAVLDGRAKHEDWAAQSQGASWVMERLFISQNMQVCIFVLDFT